jgi:hypothetical protein
VAELERTDNQHRPPLDDTQRPTGKPLIMTPTFVSRVDDTQRGERPQDNGSAKSRHGHEMHFPNWRAGALAVECDPDIAFEHWDSVLAQGAWSQVRLGRAGQLLGEGAAL